MKPLSDKSNGRSGRIPGSGSSQEVKKGKANSLGAKTVGQLATQHVVAQVGAPSSVNKATPKAAPQALPPSLPDTTPSSSPAPSHKLSTDVIDEWGDWDQHSESIDSHQYLQTRRWEIEKLLDAWEESGTDVWMGLEDLVTRSDRERFHFLAKQVRRHAKSESGVSINSDVAKLVVSDAIDFLFRVTRGQAFDTHSEDQLAIRVAAFFVALPAALDRASPDILPNASGPGVAPWEKALRDISRVVNSIKY